MATNLKTDAVFTRTIADLDPAASIEPGDSLLVSQNGTTRKASLAQFQSEFLTDDELQAHVAALNPHNVTPTQLGVYTTQQTTTAISSAITSSFESPSFSGTVTAPTPSQSNNGTAIATTKFVKNEANSVLQRAYPVGSIYFNATNGANPSSLLGFGSWTAIGKGRMLIGVDSADSDFSTSGKTGGAKSVSLTPAQIAHKHRLPNGTDSNSTYQLLDAGGSSAFGSEVQNGISGKTAGHSGSTNTVRIGYTDGAAALGGVGATPHENMPPYLSVHMWRRDG